jgi:hypothetical protein
MKFVRFHKQTLMEFWIWLFVATAVHDPRVTLFLWTSVQANGTRSTVALHRHLAGNFDFGLYKCTLYAQNFLYSIIRNWIFGWEFPCEIMCEMYVSHLLQTLDLLTTEYKNSSMVW